PAKFVRLRVQPHGLHLRPGKAVMIVHHVELEPVWLEVVAGTERVEEIVTVIFVPEALPFAPEHHRRQHVEIAKLPNDGRTRVMPPHGSRRTQAPQVRPNPQARSEEHTSELQSLTNLVCRLLLEKKKRAGSAATRARRYTDAAHR